MASFTVIFDACVLYPAPLRDLLMNIALTDLFRARWTEIIHDEWTGNLLAKRDDLTKEQLDRTVGLMNKAVPDCLVTNFEDLIPSLALPDENDRHVLAAAIPNQWGKPKTNGVRVEWHLLKRKPLINMWKKTGLAVKLQIAKQSTSPETGHDSC
jgi:hypothetical protein